METPQPHINDPQETPIVESATAVVAVVKRKHSLSRRILRGAINAFMVFLTLFLLLAFILQLPPVQNRLIDYTTTSLTKKLNTAVTIGRFSLNFFDKIDIENIYVGNQNAPNDTLLNIRRLQVDVNYLEMVWGIFQLDAIYMDSATVRMKRGVGQYDHNFQFIIDSLDKPSPENDRIGKKTDLRIGQIHLRHIDFSKDDRVQGQIINAQLKAADIHTNIMNLQHIDLTRVNLVEPFCHIQELEGTDLPPRKPRFTQAEIDSANNKIPREKRKSLNPEAAKKTPVLFQVGAVSIQNGQFFMDNWDRTPKRILNDSLFDKDHFQVFDLNLFVHNFIYSKDEFTGTVDGISCRDRSGFVLDKLTVGDAKVSSTATELYDLRIETPYSAIGDTFIMRYPNYRSFYQFTDEVVMEGHINGSKVLIDDIMTFAPQLEDNAFFRKNRKAYARINADVSGTVNKLNAVPFDIELGEGFAAKGTFRSRDLEDMNIASLSIKLEQLTTSMPSLRQLLPDFKPPADFDKLGNINFIGRFEGFLNSFVTEGDLQTALGDATMNLQLEPQSDTSAASYKGFLDLKNFSIGAFANNPDIGRVTMKTTINRGRGVTLDKLNLDLKADIQSLIFKNYDYRNVAINGNLTKKLFEGKLESSDPNVDLSFDGTIDFTASTPIYKFKSEIRRIDWLKLNLLKQDLVTNAKLDFDLTGRNINDLLGSVNVSNLLIVKDKGEFYKLDSLNIVSKLISSLPNSNGNLSPLSSSVFGGEKSLSVRSDILNADVNGLFKLEEIPETFKKVFSKYHPRFAADLNLLPQNDPLSTDSYFTTLTPPEPQVFNFNVQIPHSKTWTQLIDTKLDTLKNVTFNGNFDSQREAFEWKLLLPEANRYGDITINDIATSGRSENDILTANLGIYSIVVGKQDFKSLDFKYIMTADTLEVDLFSHDFSANLRMDTVELNAFVQREDSAYRIGFGTNTDSRLRIFGDSWTLDKDNFIFVGKNRLDIQGFEARNADHVASLESRGLRGLSLLLTNFDLKAVNQFVDDPRFVFGGKYRVWAAIEDIFSGENFGANVFMDSLMIKGENRGALVARIEGQNLKQPIDFNVVLQKNNAKIESTGKYYPSVFAPFEANSLDATLNLQSYPFQTLQLLIDEGASNFKGIVDGGVTVRGQVEKLDVNGEVRLRGGEVTVDYLKIPLFVRDEKIKITNSMFDATGGKIYDADGNVATVKGGLTHNRFLDFGLKLDVESKKFTFLNTEREDNSLFYGKAIGSGKISFSGDFARTNIKIDAKSGKGTKITFPFATEQTASENRFVVFKNRNIIDSSKIKPPSVKDLRGIDLDMNLDVTRDADMTLIFDEAQGDNIRAVGAGNFRITMPRGGSVGMTGEYKIESGEYLFTLKRIINKRFALKPGGTIRWNGSPFDAVMNIDAGYKVTAAPSAFIEEYIRNDEAAQIESRRPTPIDLTLKLTDKLLKPEINFNLAFPNLQTQSAVKSYVDSKMRLLKQDQSELNRQVFGLILIGGFLPSTSTDLSGSDLRSGGINTLTETASNLVSTLLTNLLSQYVDGLDVQIGYNYYEFDGSGNSTANFGTGQQYRAQASYRINDRATIGGSAGLEYVQQNFGNNVFFGGDFIFDYAITEDRRLKLRVSYTRDQVSDGRRDKPAVGIRYRREFNTFDELIDNLQGKKKAAKTDGLKKTELEN